MKVVVDNQIFLRQRFGGVSRMFCETNLAMQEVDGINQRIVAPLHFNKHLQVMDLSKSTSIYIPNCPAKLRPFVKKSSDLFSKAEINNFKPDLIHETFYTDYDPWNKLIPRVTTVNDLTRELIDKNLKRAEIKRESMARASAIICISENTKSDVVNYFGIDPNKCFTVPLGISEIFFQNKQKIENKINATTTKDFFLFVGDRDGYKNFEKFIKAFSLTKDLIKNFSIKCFGGPTPSISELNIIKDLRLSEGQVEFISGTDETLAQLYRNAFALIYPSLYEGFGLPPLEAMASGCSVLSSNKGSLPEVLGEAANFFDPTSIESINIVLQDFVASTELRKELIAKGLIQSQKYSWKATAQKTFEVYKNLIS